MKVRLGRGGIVAACLLLLGASRPDLYEIPLEGVGPSSRIGGKAVLTPAKSPFGIATTKDGFFVLEIEIQAPALPPSTSFGPQLTQYVAWVADHNLETIKPVGGFEPGKTVKGRVTFNKYLVIVTAEPAGTPGERWTGPIVLRGRSPSSYLSNFSGHTMFSGGVPQ